MTPKWSEELVEAPDGTRLYVRSCGRSGPTFVLNDGVACDGYAWRHLIPYFRQVGRVIHWHYPGHGRSGRPRSSRALTIPFLAQSLSTILQSLNARKAIIVGHSMGTQVALEAARQRSERIEGLVLICGSAGRITQLFHGNDKLFRALPSMKHFLAEHGRLGRAIWHRMPKAIAFRLACAAREIDPERMTFDDFTRYWEHVRRLDPEMYATMLQRAGEHSAEDMLEECAYPALVIGAEKDTFTPVAYMQAMADVMPRSTYVQIANASHAAPLEQPEAMIRALSEYLARHGLAKRTPRHRAEKAAAPSEDTTPEEPQPPPRSEQKFHLSSPRP